MLGRTHPRQEVALRDPARGEGVRRIDDERLLVVFPEVDFVSFFIFFVRSGTDRSIAVDNTQVSFNPAENN